MAWLLLPKGGGALLRELIHLASLRWCHRLVLVVVVRRKVSLNDLDRLFVDVRVFVLLQELNLGQTICLVDKIRHLVLLRDA